MKIAQLLVATLCLSFLALGCSGPDHGSLDSQYTGADAEALGKARHDMLVKYSGNYDKMSPEDKQTYLKGFPDETAAKKFWDAMAHPPSSGPMPVGVGPRGGNAAGTTGADSTH